MAICNVTSCHRKLKEILVRKLRARLNAWAFERDLERGFYYQNGWNTRDPKVWNEYDCLTISCEDNGMKKKLNEKDRKV